MICSYDIAILKRWLHLARMVGTDAIKIVVGDEQDTYKVTVKGGESWAKKKQ